MEGNSEKKSTYNDLGMAERKEMQESEHFLNSKLSSMIVRCGF